MRILADLHLHSPFSRATSERLSPAGLEAAARGKGIDLLGSGDACHPAWLERLSRELEPAEEGFFRLASGPSRDLPAGGLASFDRPRFVLSAELATVYRAGGRGRRVHHLVLLPDFAAARGLQARLLRFGKIESDGRPLLRLDSRDLLELLLETDPRAILIPAHIWTPWYSVLGASSGFDSISSCYRDLSSRTGAVETGLSSDPPMNWALSSLDPYAIVSNSDAHSPEKLGREATVFEMEASYAGLAEALSGAGGGKKGRVLETIEFFPEEGKYFWDGHRACGVALAPADAAALGRLCPVCGKPLTAGVLRRVMELADRPLRSGGSEVPSPEAPNRRPFRRLLPLRELLAEILGAGKTSRRLEEAYGRLLRAGGSELAILSELPPGEAAMLGGGGIDGDILAEALARLRAGRVYAEPGADGRYGRIRLFAPGELGDKPRRTS